MKGKINIEKMKKLWNAILNTDLGMHVSFFETGDSLSAHILLASIEKEFSTRIDFAKLVENSTMQELLDYMNRSALESA